jgi:hypothetical protein
MELAGVVGLHEVLCIGEGGGLVEALLERLSRQGSRGDVVGAHALMDVRQQRLPFFLGDAAELDPAITPLIEFPIYQRVHLGLTSNALGLLVILGKGAVA